MAKITITPTQGGLYSRKQINDNFQKIADELNNKVHYRDNPVGEPNSMQNPLDMNSHRVINLTDGSSPSDAITKRQLDAASDLVSVDASVSQYDIGQTGSVTRTVKGKLDEVATAEDFGAVGDGTTDDTTALQNLFDLGGDIYLGDGEYLFSSLNITRSFNLTGPGKLKSDNSLSPLTGLGGATVLINISSSFTADKLEIIGVGATDLTQDILNCTGDDISIGELRLVFDAQRNTTGGSTFQGSRIEIGRLHSVNVARPIAFQNETPTTVRDRMFIGSVYIKNFIRGVKFSYANDFTVDRYYMEERWSGQAVGSPGHNGFLIEVCNQWEVGDGYIEKALEHSFRIGGAGNSDSFSIGDLTTKDSSGCSLKINVDPTYLASNFTVGSVTGVNSGEGTNLGNTELVRLTRVDSAHFGPITGLVDCVRALIVADTSNCNFESIYGEGVAARLIQLDDGQDSSSLGITNVTIEKAVGYMDGARSAYELTYTRAVDNFRILDSFVTGMTNFVANTNGLNLTGEMEINARVKVGDPTTFENTIASDSLTANIQRGFETYCGRSDRIAFSGQVNRNGTSPDLGASPSERAQFMAMSQGGTPGAGAYGSIYGFGRVGSTRRGAAIGLKQATADDKENGVVVFSQDTSSTSNETITEHTYFHPNGTIQPSFMPTYADDAAAGVGGLTAGMMYQTATGEVRIKT